MTHVMTSSGRIKDQATETTLGAARDVLVEEWEDELLTADFNTTSASTTLLAADVGKQYEIHAIQAQGSPDATVSPVITVTFSVSGKVLGKGFAIGKRLRATSATNEAVVVANSQSGERITGVVYYKEIV